MAEANSSAGAAAAEDKLLVSKTTLRQIERNSHTMYALADTSNGTVVSRVSLLANEIMRNICEREVDEDYIKQLDFYVRDRRLQEEGAEPVIILAQSIRAIAMDIGKIAEPDEHFPLPKIKPPLNFGEDSDGMENTRARPVARPVKRIKRRNPHALFRKAGDTDEDEFSDREDERPVTAENDLTIRQGPTLKFRPLTPDHERIEESDYDPSPPPSPVAKNEKRTKGRKRSKETSSDEDDFDMIFDNGPSNTTMVPAVPKETVCCFMCDMLFYADDQLTQHLVHYHRLKPGSSLLGGEDIDQSASSAASDEVKPLHHTISRTPVIGTAKPINGTTNSNGTVRQTPTTIVDSNGIVKTYSNASNAARAAAKAAAAAANGVFRPNLPAKPYTCKHCGMMLQSQQMYASHVRYAHPKDKLPGETSTSPRKNSNTSSAIVHVQNDDGTKTFQCRRCEKAFDSAQKVAGHSRHCLLVYEGKARPANQGPVPSEDRPWTVYRCGLGSDLARTCPYCGEVQTSIRKVDKHVRLMHEHARHEVYGCTTCDRRFVTLGGIENHWLHYGDCPSGVLTVHSDDKVTCADIGPKPPGVKKPKVITKPATDTTAHTADQIANTILGQYGYRVQKQQDAPNVPNLTNGNSANSEEDEEETPVLKMNGTSARNGTGHSRQNTATKTVPNKGILPIVSMKVIQCRKCIFAARTRESMDVHEAEHHPEDVAGTSTASEDDEMNGGPSTRNDDSTSGSKNKQSTEVRRILSPK